MSIDSFIYKDDRIVPLLLPLVISTRYHYNHIKCVFHLVFVWAVSGPKTAHFPRDAAQCVISAFLRCSLPRVQSVLIACC